MAGIAITKKAKARKAEWERICNLTAEERDEEYKVKAGVAWEQAWQLVTQEDGWKRETKEPKVKDGGVKDISNGVPTPVVYSRQVTDLGKVFRVEADVAMDPASLFDLMVTEAHTFPSWNPTILESKVVYDIDACTDLAYYVTAEAARGAVDSRDFINVRRWGSRGDTLLSAAISVVHPDFPPFKKYVRGENRIGGGMAFRAVPGQPHRCRFIWIVNSDLKGLLPNKLVEEAIPDVCLETMASLNRERITPAAQNGTTE